MSMIGGTINLDNAADHLIFDAVLFAAGGTINHDAGTITFNSSSTIGAATDFQNGATTNLDINAFVTVNDANWDWDALGGSGRVITIGDLGTLNANITAAAADDIWTAVMHINSGSLNVQADDNTWGQNGGSINIGGNTLSTIGGDRFEKTGGTFNVAAGANVDITAQSDWGNGTFDVDGEAELIGATEWAGANVTGDGILEQDGNATVTFDSNIGVHTYDWDQAVTTVNPNVTFTIDVTNIDRGNDTFNNNDINVNSGTLSVNVADNEWALGGGGDLFLTNTGAGNPVLNGDTLRVLNAGDIFVDGGAQINAEVIFDEGSDMTIQGSGGIVTFSGGFTLDGGDIIDTIDRSLADSEVNVNSPLTVTGVSTVNVEYFDWDNSSTTIGTNGDLSIVVDSIDGNGVAQIYQGTLTMNGGDLSVSSNQATWVMEGWMTMNNIAGDIPVLSGEGIDIGDDNVSLDPLSATLHVGGMGVSRIGLIDFNSDARVVISAGATLELTSIVDFDTQNGAENAEFTGTGTLRIGQSTVNVNEALTINMVGGTVDLDGDNVDIFATINIDALMIINAAAIEDFGDGFENLDVDNLNAGKLGSLTVILDDANAEWTLAPAGTLTLRNDNSFQTLLFGSDVNLNGTVNVTGDVSSNARVDIGGTVNILTAGERFRVNGGSNLDPNTINGGTVEGPGQLSATTNKALHGNGTINADVNFFGTARLIAEGGLLNVNGTIIDMGRIGTLDTGIDPVLNIANAWNTNIAHEVLLQGGRLQGGNITNDLAGGISGFGLILSQVNNNTAISASGGTLVVDNTATDWDGSSETGTLNAVSGDMEVRDTIDHPFNGTVNIGSGRELFASGFALDFEPGSTLSMTGGTYRSTDQVRLAGTVNINAGSNSTLQNDQTVIFRSGGSTTLTGDLQLDTLNTIVEAGATFAGGGALINLAGSTLRLEDAADVDVLVQNDGTLVLGTSPGQTTGTDFQQTATGTWEVDLMGTGINDFDRMNLTGLTQLAGTLDLSLLAPYVPSLGDPLMNILSASGGLGGTEFDTVLQPTGMPAGLEFAVNYLATIVQLEVVSIPMFAADFDEDGDVDAADLVKWETGFGTSGTAVHMDGDADGDDDVDGSDFLTWQRQFGSGVPTLASSQAVPEPATLYMLLLGVAAMFSASRKRS